MGQNSGGGRPGGMDCALGLGVGSWGPGHSPTVPSLLVSLRERDALTLLSVPQIQVILGTGSWVINTPQMFTVALRRPTEESHLPTVTSDPSASALLMI